VIYLYLDRVRVWSARLRAALRPHVGHEAA
jgi:hypothetical protein